MYFVELNPFFCLTYVRLIFPVFITLKCRDGREYKIGFPVELGPQKNARVLVQLQDLNEDVNGIRVFLNCQLIGEDTTEEPIRKVFENEVDVVGALYFNQCTCVDTLLRYVK